MLKSVILFVLFYSSSSVYESLLQCLKSHPQCLVQSVIPRKQISHSAKKVQCFLSCHVAEIYFAFVNVSCSAGNELSFNSRSRTVNKAGIDFGLVRKERKK